MTVSTSFTREFDIDTLVRRAYQLCGLVPATTGTLESSKATMGRDFLEMIVDELQTTTWIVRQRQFESVAIVAGTATYAMPSYVLNVIGDASFLETGQTSGETPVTPMSMQDYNALPNKAQSGRAYRYYIHRTSAMTLYLWPVPDVAGTLKTQIHKLLADNNDGTKTLDLERHWGSYITYALASRLALANSLDLSVVGTLEGLAEKRRQEALRYSAPDLPTQMFVHHSTPWSK